MYYIWIFLYNHLTVSLQCYFLKCNWFQFDSKLFNFFLINFSQHDYIYIQIHKYRLGLSFLSLITQKNSKGGYKR